MYIMLIGLAISGWFSTHTLIPLMPEMIEAVSHKYRKNQEELNDMLSAIFNTGFGTGEVLGPLLAPILVEQFGFKMTCEIISFFTLGFAVIYFIFGDGITVFKNFNKPLLDVDDSKSQSPFILKNYPTKQDLEEPLISENKKET
jgi:MFS family permease